MRFDKTAPGNQECLQKAKPDEPMFILLGRDPAMAGTVEFWAEAREAAITKGQLPDTPQERAHIESAKQFAAAARAYSQQSK